MEVSTAIQLLSKATFKYVNKDLSSVATKKYEQKKYHFCTESEFFTLLPRISGCGFQPSLEANVNYILEREKKLLHLYEEYNGNPYCSTWWIEAKPLGEAEITFGYETTSGTIAEITFTENSGTFYAISIPISRSRGNHDTLLSYVQGGATPRLLDIRHSFYCVEKAEYEEYAAWWNTKNFGDPLPEWEVYDRQRQQQREEARKERVSKEPPAVEEDCDDWEDYEGAYDADDIE
jgi:hypothetical protein